VESILNNELIEKIYWVILAGNLIVLTVTIVNLFTAPVLRNIFSPSEFQPKISILIPARNEQENLPGSINSILKQSYKNFEIIILDDNSTDETLKIARNYESENKNISVIEGKSLLAGWLGKNYACYQLSRAASGELFLFMDADVELAKHAISYAVSEYSRKSVKMLTVFPTQKLRTFGERLVVPMMNWLLLAFLPLIMVYRSKNVKLAAANGQFILIEKEAYENTGGHFALKDSVVEDMSLVKKVKHGGGKVLTALGGDSVFCRMYDGFNSSVRGFSKNFFPGLGVNPVLFLLILMFFLLLFFIPFPLIPLKGFDLIVGVVLLQRIFISIVSRQNMIQNILLHPLQMLILMYVGISSFYLNITKKVKWKERIIWKS